MRIAIVGGTNLRARLQSASRCSARRRDRLARRRPRRADRRSVGRRGRDEREGREKRRPRDPGRCALERCAGTAGGSREAIGTTPLLSVASALEFTDDGIAPGQHGYSLAEEIERIVDAPIAAGLQSLAAVHLMSPDPPDEDVLVCGAPSAAKDLTLELAGRLVKGRAIDVGPLANARALEGMTAVILNVNKRYKAHAGIRLTGLE
jgi:hypothetical protein